MPRSYIFDDLIYDLIYIIIIFNPNASGVFFSFKFLWAKNGGKLAENSDFAEAGGSIPGPLALRACV